MANTRGLAGILRNINAYSRELKRDLTLDVFRATTNIEGTAKSKVVVDTGKLKQSIYHRMDYAKATGQVGATEFYAPFIEFGTGGNVEIPNGFADFASEFKGAGVRTINRSAQPFLIPAFLEETQKLKEEIKKTVTRYSGSNRR
jgi:HK97 gp10 family phage protein